MAPPLKAQFTGIPEQSLGVLNTPEEFSIGIINNIASLSPGGDVSGTRTGSSEIQSRQGFLNKIMVDMSITTSVAGADGRVNGVIDVFVRGFKIFTFSKFIHEPAGHDHTENISETFDLTNLIEIAKNDLVTYVLKIESKDPQNNFDVSINSTLTVKGILQR
jgi:hypothetical protein